MTAMVLDASPNTVTVVRRTPSKINLKLIPLTTSIGKCSHEVSLVQDIFRTSAPSKRVSIMNLTLHSCLWVSQKHFFVLCSCVNGNHQRINYSNIRSKNLLLHVQPADIGWPTGNGKKLSCTQACCLAQLCLAAAYFLSISCGQSYVRRLYFS